MLLKSTVYGLMFHTVVFYIFPLDMLLMKSIMLFIGFWYDPVPKGNGSCKSRMRTISNRSWNEEEKSWQGKTVGLLQSPTCQYLYWQSNAFRIIHRQYIYGFTSQKDTIEDSVSKLQKTILFWILGLTSWILSLVGIFLLTYFQWKFFFIREAYSSRSFSALTYQTLKIIDWVFSFFISSPFSAVLLVSSHEGARHVL